MDIKILIVDDEVEIAEGYEMLLQGTFNCTSVHTVAEAIQLVSKSSPDAVITDLRFPGESGMDLLKFLENFPAIATVAISGYTQQLNHKTVVDRFLPKPVMNANKFHAVIQEALTCAKNRMLVKGQSSP